MSKTVTLDIIATAECGCTVVRDRGSVAVRLELCPLHALQALGQQIAFQEHGVVGILSLDLFQRPHLRRLEKVPSERNLVPKLRRGLIDPGVGHMRKNLAAEERFDAAFLQQRNLLAVA